MEFAFLYDLLEREFVEYRKKQEKSDTYFNTCERKEKEMLKNMLNEEQNEFFKRYCHSKALVEEDIDYAVGMRILLYGIKIGIGLIKGFESIE